jgi:hypothetical protein
VVGRIGIAAQMVGLAQGAFDKAVPYTYERKQFGQPVGTFQGMAFQIAQAAVDLESARLLTYNAARRKEEGRSYTKEAAMAKYLASVVAQRVSGQAIEWAGGVGFTRETGIEKFWRDSKIVSQIVRYRGYSSNSTASRAPSMKGRPTYNYRLSPSLFRRNTHSSARTPLRLEQICNIVKGHLTHNRLFTTLSLNLRQLSGMRRLAQPCEGTRDRVISIHPCDNIATHCMVTSVEVELCAILKGEGGCIQLRWGV